jgi:hypothetical protein
MAIAECSLAELMEDPLVGLVMRSDGVDRCELALLFERVGRGQAWADWPERRPGSPPRPKVEAAPCSRC